MGIFMDTIEDNFERIGIYSDKNWEWNGTQIISRLHYCPICSAACASEFEVQDHMFRNHRHYQAYVKVNGKVITKDSFINEPINRIEIHYVGLQYIEGSWKNGETKGSFIAKSDEPFLLYPSQKLPVISDVIEITLGQGRQNMIFSIVQTHNSSLQYEQMEYLFFEYQDTYLRSRDKFLWSSFRNAFQHLSKNPYELQYMSGLFDYLFGIHMEEQDPSNKQSLKFLERAYTQLAPFPTILAHTVKTTLSFKLNWFSRLRNLPEQSIFYQLGYFLNNYYEDNATRNFARGSFAGPLYGVYVDDFHFLYHEAVILLFAKEAEELGKKLSAIRGVYNKKSVTNKEKLELLEGRYYQLIGDNKRAVMAYGSMSYHPIFSKEVDLIKMKM